MKQLTPSSIYRLLLPMSDRLRSLHLMNDGRLAGEAAIAIHELQAALREVVTDMESWTESEYSGTDELDPRMAKLQAYHRLFED